MHVQETNLLVPNADPAVVICLTASEHTSNNSNCDKLVRVPFPVVQTLILQGLATHEDLVRGPESENPRALLVT